jgi:two-component system OmpR family sensor kinase
MRAASPDRAMLSRARLVLALQTAGAIAATLLIVAVLVLVVESRAAHAVTTTLLSRTFSTEDDVVDPPPDVWLFDERPDGSIAHTASAPAGLPDQDALRRVRAGGGTTTTAIEVDGRGYKVMTGRRHGDVVQVVASLRAEHDEQQRVIKALVLSGTAGVALAFLLSLLLARRATAPLEDALTRQRQFVADASHELRTPLTQLHLRAQLLQRELRAGSDTAAVADDVDHLVIGTRQLGEVVDDLLTSTQAARQVPDLAIVNLRQVVADVLAGQADRARGQDVDLALIPDTTGDSAVRGREAALRRVVTALVDNALSHTPPGGHITVELGSAGQPRHVTVVVRDDGSGFDPQDAERLFARFARGHGDHRRFGLGLALAREVIAGHGGTIDAWGSPGEGAAFTIELPAAESAGPVIG